MAACWDDDHLFYVAAAAAHLVNIDWLQNQNRMTVVVPPLPFLSPSMYIMTLVVAVDELQPPSCKLGMDGPI